MLRPLASLICDISSWLVSHLPCPSPSCVSTRLCFLCPRFPTVEQGSRVEINVCWRQSKDDAGAKRCRCCGRCRRRVRRRCKWTAGPTSVSNNASFLGDAAECNRRNKMQLCNSGHLHQLDGLCVLSHRSTKTGRPPRPCCHAAVADG